MTAPATMATGIPIVCPIPMSAIPTVAVVDQEEPVLKLTRAEIITAVGKKKVALIRSNP